MIIREARYEDIPWLLEQLRAFDRFFRAKRSLVPADPEVATGFISALIDQAKAMNGVFDIATSAGHYVGFVAGVLAPHPFNAEIIVLGELFWWVDPQYRGSSAGARLLQRFEEFGRERADWVTMTLEANSPVDPSSLTRRGYRPFETNYLLELGEGLFVHPDGVIRSEPPLDLELPEMAVVAE